MDKYMDDIDGYAIPFTDVIDLIEFYPYAHPYRVAFTLIALTGCRIAELNNIGANSFRGNFLIWKTGKNQKGYRRERIPNWFMLEINEYIKKHPTSQTRLFQFKTEWLRDKLNKIIRPALKGNWLVQKPIPIKNGAVQKEYLYQLKGLRHNFATLTFYNQFLKWGGTVAVEFTCKRMKHSSYKMTAGHYIGNFERLDIEKYKALDMSEIINNGKQKKIIEYM